MSKVNFIRQELVVVGISRPRTDAGRIVVIHTNGNANHDIVRSEAQFITDLENSFFNVPKGAGIDHPSVIDAMGVIRNGIQVSLSAAKVEKDSEYALDENSREVKNGKGAVGELRKRNRAQFLVEQGTFLDFRLSATQMLDVKKLNKENPVSDAMNQLFGTFMNSVATKTVGTAIPEEKPEPVVEEVVEETTTEEAVVVEEAAEPEISAPQGKKK